MLSGLGLESEFSLLLYFNSLSPGPGLLVRFMYIFYLKYTLYDIDTITVLRLKRKRLSPQRWGVCMCVRLCLRACGRGGSHGQRPLHSSFRRPQAAPRAMAPHRYIASRSSAVQSETAAGAAPPAPLYGKKRERCGRLKIGTRLFKIIDCFLLQVGRVYKRGVQANITAKQRETGGSQDQRGGWHIPQSDTFKEQPQINNI